MIFLKKTVLTVLTILLILNIGPASAMSIQEINQHYQDDMNRYNNANWWYKIWHFGDVFTAIHDAQIRYQDEIANIKNQGESALNDAKNKESQLNQIQAQINKLKSENTEEGNLSEADILLTQQAIAQNNKQPTNNQTNKTTNTNNTNNQTNKTTNTNNTNNQTNKTTDINDTNNTSITISEPAQKDGKKNVKKYLDDHQIKYKEVKTDLTHLQKGNIIQLLKGDVFKYWIFESYNPETGNITLTSGNGNTITTNLEKFTNSFTGLVYQIENDNNSPNETTNTIQKIQENQIANETAGINQRINEEETWWKNAGIMSLSGLGALIVATFLMAIGLIICSIGAGLIEVPVLLFILMIAGVVITILGGYILTAGTYLFIGGFIAYTTLSFMKEHDKKEKQDIENKYKSDEI